MTGGVAQSDDREHRKRNIDNGIHVECLYHRFLDAPIAEQLYLWPVRVLRRHDEIEGLHQAAVGQGARNNGASAQRHPIAGTRRILSGD